MALQYVTYQNNRKGGNHMHYARVIHPQTIGLAELAARVQRQCSMTKGDVLAVITELVTVMQDEMHNSNKVKLDGLGTFYLAINTSGALEADEFNVMENIKGVKVNFLAEGKRVNGKVTRAFVEGVKFIKAQPSVQ